MTTKQNSQASLIKHMFLGQIKEEDIFPFPKLSAEEREMGEEMVNAVNKYANDHFKSEEYDHTSKIPPEIIQGLAQLGLCGLAVPEEYGGIALDYTLYSRVFMEIATYDGSIAVTLGAHQSIGYRALLNEGSDEQKKKYLPQLASGEKLAAFCLTEPGSGSDAFSIKTLASENEDGSFSITGQKIWITNGGLADFYTVFCKTKLKNEEKISDKISCFILEKGMEGLTFGEPEKKMGIKASETRAVFMDQVKVPKENLIGQLGQGFKICLNVLNSGRLSLGAGCVGGMKTIIKMAVEHANQRKQFGRTINEFGIIQEKLSIMAANCYAAESVVFLVTGKIQSGMLDYSLESAVCKVFNSEALWETIDIGLQIAAGNGYMKEYPYERIMRDSRINLIFEGTNEILRCLIALSGLKAPSEKLKDLGKVTDISQALHAPLKSLGMISDFAFKRISTILPARSFHELPEELKDMGEKLGVMLQEFAIKVEDTLIKHGKKIIENEFPQQRLANMAIELFVMLCTLSRSTHLLKNEKLSTQDREYILSLTHLVTNRSRHKCIKEFKSLEKNQDKHIEKISKHLSQKGYYQFDIISE